MTEERLKEVIKKCFETEGLQKFVYESFRHEYLTCLLQFALVCELKKLNKKLESIRVSLA